MHGVPLLFKEIYNEILEDENQYEASQSSSDIEDEDESFRLDLPPIKRKDPIIEDAEASDGVDIINELDGYKSKKV